MSAIQVSFCGCDNYHDQLQLKQRKGLFGLHFQATVLHWEKAGQEQKQELEAETMEGHHLLVCSQAHSELAFFYRTPCLGMPPPTVAWILLHQIAIKAIPHKHGCRQIESDNSSIEVFL